MAPRSASAAILCSSRVRTTLVMESLFARSPMRLLRRPLRNRLGLGSLRARSRACFISIDDGDAGRRRCQYCQGSHYVQETLVKDTVLEESGARFGLRAVLLRLFLLW